MCTDLGLPGIHLQLRATEKSDVYGQYGGGGMIQYARSPILDKRLSGVCIPSWRLYTIMAPSKPSQGWSKVLHHMTHTCHITWYTNTHHPVLFRIIQIEAVIDKSM